MPFPKRWISVKECAAFLSLNKMTVYSLIYAHKIKAVRIGRSVRVDLRSLEADLEKQVKTI
ncbi:MAG: helix-turn-helix domain-containing protein [Anaerolineales bacterium]|nr:MAG: helix-turn-helix domain-containing protein [Anaerolineales bacterium]